MHHNSEHGESLVEYERRRDGGHVCPWVGCSYVGQNEYGVGQHHVKAHGKSLTQATKVCDVCGEEFNVSSSRADTARFCSRSCQRERWETRWTVVPCDQCGSDVERLKWNVEEFDHTFCDENCRREWTADYLSGETSPFYKCVEVKCHTCSEQLTRHAWEISRSERFFCDKDCLGKWRETTTGPEHPRWKGGFSPYYGPNWHLQRRRALERDDYTCQSCGVNQSDHTETMGRELDVHHIRRKESFGTDYDSANDLNNLVTLCRSCHKTWEGIPLRPRFD
jgi:5-methylcytosine-specific restriction endonuclease McrA